MAAMFVHVLGDIARAEAACRMVFGEDADAGPLVASPKPLLDLLAQWPGHADEVLTVALHLPRIMFRPEVSSSERTRSAVELRLCKLDVLHEGRKIGEALRTDALGINAIELYERALASMRQAH